MNTLSKITFVALFTIFISNAEASKPKCKIINESVPRDSKLYQYVDELADLHVYYGDIRAKKMNKISKTFLTDICTKDGMKGYVVRFQTWAKLTTASAQKLFYCYSKIIQYGSNDLRNQGTFCTPVKSTQISPLEFPYDLPSDPYSRYTEQSSGSSDVDGLEDEFNHSRSVGIDSGFDPFYDTQNRHDDGPDSRSGSGL
jgi:hypothetical protein